MTTDNKADSGVGKRLTGIIVLLLAVAGVLWVKNSQKDATGVNGSCCSTENAPDVASCPGGVCAVNGMGTDGQSAAQANAATPGTTTGKAANPASTEKPQALPRLVDLGAGKCIPCKMMEPVLEELRKEQAGKLEIEFIDVWQKPGEGEKYGVRIIPTQIFFNAEGKELFRHEGFMAKEDILAKWKELGFGF